MMTYQSYGSPNMMLRHSRISDSYKVAKFCLYEWLFTIFAERHLGISCWNIYQDTRQCSLVITRYCSHFFLMWCVWMFPFLDVSCSFLFRVSNWPDTKESMLLSILFNKSWHIINNFIYCKPQNFDFKRQRETQWSIRF